MKSYFTLLSLSIFFCHYVQYSACQQAKGSVSHDDKSPFDDCSVINELNQAKCKNKIGQLGQPKGRDHHGDVASGSHGGIISGQGGKVNGSAFVVTGHSGNSKDNDTRGNGKENGTEGHHSTPEPKTNELFNCSHENFTRGSSFENCTFENVTTHVAKTTATAATTPLLTTTTTLPTSTVDLPALFSKLGISTEKPEPTSTVRPLYNRTDNFTEFLNETHFNLTEVFNITMEFNLTELILEEHPDLPDHILKEYADVEKASNHIFYSGDFSCRQQRNSASGKGKPALVVFDRVKLTKCDKKPHPVTKLIYFLAESRKYCMQRLMKSFSDRERTANFYADCIRRLVDFRNLFILYFQKLSSNIKITFAIAITATIVKQNGKIAKLMGKNFVQKHAILQSVQTVSSNDFQL